MRRLLCDYISMTMIAPQACFGKGLVLRKIAGKTR